MMKRLLLGMVAALLVAFPALGQLPGGSLVVGSNGTPIQGGTSGDCLTVGSDGRLSQTALCGAAAGLTVGTSTITGGTTTRILYDNAGVLGEYTLTGTGTVAVMQTSPSLITPAIGVATGASLVLTPVAANSSALTLTGGTITALAPLLDATRTWNNAGVTFTALRLNITDTASSAASLLEDLQVASASKWSVDKAGNVTAAGTVTGAGGTFTSVTVIGGGSVSTGANYAMPNTGALFTTSRGGLSWGADGQPRMANNADTGFDRYIFGANDATGIALKKNGTAFNFRLGNDSADAAITAAAGTFSGAVTVPGVTTAALTSTGTFTSGAGAQVGTLTNAPAAGNPTSWIKIVDNGVTRYIPAW